MRRGEILRIEAKCDNKGIEFYNNLGFKIKSIGKNYYEEEYFICWIEF